MHARRDRFDAAITQMVVSDRSGATARTGLTDSNRSARSSSARSDQCRPTSW